METLGLIKEVGAYSERQTRHENALYITDLQSL